MNRGWRGLRFSLASVAVGAGAAAALPASYLLAVTARAAQVAGRRRETGSVDSARTTRFAVCIPAHDEESIIADTVSALCSQAYAAGAWAVHVVADNCTDGTAEVARASGATVHERRDLDAPGKGPALNWLHGRLEEGSFDVLVVIDADTIAEPGFLTAMNRAFVDGADVAQGYYGVRDPDTSPAVALRFAALACRHHLRPLARTSVGASCGLYGNGMAFRADVIKDRPWSGHLIEDAEFQMALLLDGIVVTYVPDARVAAEMPFSFEASATQNERWELGRLQLIRRFVPPLLARVRSGGSLPRHVYLDGALDHAIPPLSVVAALDVGAVSAGVISIAVTGRRSGRFAVVVGLVSTAILATHVLLALRLVQAPRSVYSSLREAPRLVFWKIALLLRVASRPDEVTWSRTERNASADPSATDRAS